jgi:hypothetical protein
VTSGYDTTAVLTAKLRLALPPGTKVLVVNQQTEPQLRRDLEDLFDWKITWYSLGDSGGIRKAGAAAEAIRNGSYALVLGSTGLFAHKYDKLIAVAARNAATPYVRVNKGRVGISVVAIARSLGLLGV